MITSKENNNGTKKTKKNNGMKTRGTEGRKKVLDGTFEKKKRRDCVTNLKGDKRRIVRFFVTGYWLYNSGKQWKNERKENAVN